MEQGLSLTVWGMGIVFTVLFIIYFSIVILGWYEQKFPSPEPSAPVKKSSTPKRSSFADYTDEEFAAIKGALALHLNKKPEDFDIKIK